MVTLLEMLWGGKWERVSRIGAMRVRGLVKRVVASTAAALFRPVWGKLRRRRAHYIRTVDITGRRENKGRSMNSPLDEFQRQTVKRFDQLRFEFLMTVKLAVPTQIFADHLKAIHHRHRAHSPGLDFPVQHSSNETWKPGRRTVKRIKKIFESWRPYSVRQAWWKSVYLIDVSQGSFPSVKSRDWISVFSSDSRPWQIKYPWKMMNRSVE